MENGTGRYVIRGGRPGYDRLLVLSQERWPDTQAFFRRAGLGPGMQCLDVGCGGGAVTIEMARIVGPNGHVEGIDMDPVKLELAASAAKHSGVGNVRFRRQLVQDWSATSSYDVVYSRFLLQHLTNPGTLLQQMWAAVRPGGILMVEDCDWTGWSADPPSPGVDFLRERYIKLLERRGGDPRIGLKLARYFRGVGAGVSGIAVQASLRTERAGKQLAWLTVETCSEAFLSENIATREEIDAALADLVRHADDPASIDTGPKIFQVHAIKPRSSS